MLDIVGMRPHGGARGLAKGEIGLVNRTRNRVETNEAIQLRRDSFVPCRDERGPRRVAEIIAASQNVKREPHK